MIGVSSFIRMKSFIFIVYFISTLSIISCNVGSNSSDNNRGKTLAKPNNNNTNDKIIYPPVPDGCTLRGRWHIANINDTTLHVYVTIFDCKNVYYVTRNGCTLKLKQINECLYESYEDSIFEEYYKITNGELRLGQEGYGDVTDEYGYIITPY